MDRTERLLDLVALLLAASEPVSFAELRESFPKDYGGAREAAERKLERDKAELVGLGVPIEFAPSTDDRELGGYLIDRKAFFLPDARLLPEENAALYAAGAAALAAHDFPFAQDLAHALRKISLSGGSSPQQAVPGAVESALGSAAARRLLIVRPGDPARAGKLKALSGAVLRRKRVHLTYQGAPSLDGRARPERTEREVDPYGLAFRAGAWRLVGYCHLRKSQRVFVVDRIEQLNVSEEKPNSPDFEVPAGFDAGLVAGKRPWEWVGSVAAAVQLQFAPGCEMLAERAFDQSLAAGQSELSLQVTYLDGLLPHVLSFGDRVWIAAPEQARSRVEGVLRDLFERLAKQVEKAESIEPQPAQPQPVQPAPPPSAAPFSKPPPHGGSASRRTQEAAGDKHARLRRLLLVVPAARRRPGIKVEELAHELGLDPHELLADIDLLGLVGRPPFNPDDLIDISVDEQGRVSVALDQSFSRPPQLTPLEALALAAAAQAVAPADPAVVSALAKLTSQLPAAAQQLYSALTQRLAGQTPAPRGTLNLLALLRTAAERRQAVVLEYDKEGRGAAEDRAIWPLTVLDHGGRWYVVGLDQTRNAERTFRLDRIRKVRETGQTFPDQGPLDASRFQRETLFFPTGAEEPVVLRFSPAAAPWALSRYGQKAIKLKSGGVQVSIESAGSGYAVSLALSFVGEAEIVAPLEAREALRAEVERALRRYAV